MSKIHCKYFRGSVKGFADAIAAVGVFSSYQERLWY